MLNKTVILLAVILLPLGVLQAQQGSIDSIRNELGVRSIDSTRGGLHLLEEPAPPRMADVENEDRRRVRAYPMQPPTIPHKIDGYQVDMRHNRCLSCHSRHRIEVSQAPMISVTHYMDRDGNFLASVSPRRYFCDQCHVIQTEARPLVENTYQDVDTIIQRLRAGDPQ